MHDLNDLRKHLDHRLDGLERKVSNIATRDELNKVKAQLKEAIAAETEQVTAAIQDLRDQLAAGSPITDEDLSDLQADIAGVGNVLPDVPPTT